MASVQVNGTSFEIKIQGLRDGDTVKGIGEQCEGCGNSLDCQDEYGGAFAILRTDGMGYRRIECSECNTTYVISQ